MYRNVLAYLQEWKDRKSRKPLVLRGARQVGKSYLVRELARTSFGSLAEINFEAMPDLADLFASNDPNVIVPLLETRLGMRIEPGRTLLFLDEMQAAPTVMVALRYFYEKLPQLHVVAAGSLLEFVLEEHSFPMPVGRIEYMHLGPMTFEEFLRAAGRDQLVDFLQRFRLPLEVPQSIHDELLRWVRIYLVTGGMPYVVQAYTKTGSFVEAERAGMEIVATYRDDFAKYGHRVQHRRVEKVFSMVPRLIAQKFMYTQVDREERSRDLKQALHLLELARVVHCVRHTHANGLPLAAETEDRHFKVIFLDVGLVARATGLSMDEVATVADIMVINSGALCEQFIGQHLAYAGQPFAEPELFCWMRQERSANAEVDYLLPFGTRIVPVEVKAGKAGSLRSLHVFVDEKGCDFALRFNAGLPSLLDGHTCLRDKPAKSFRLLSLPLYLVGQTRRLCKEAVNE